MTTSPPGRYRALLIGNNFYSDPHLKPLTGPDREVDALEVALTDAEYGLFYSDDVRPMYGLSSADMQREIGEFFGAAQPDDVLLLFFSGHGINRYGHLYLCAADTRLDRIETSAIDAELIKQLADRGTSAMRVVVLLDCCRSGVFKSGSLDFSRLHGVGQYILTSTYGEDDSHDALQGESMSKFAQHLVDGLSGAASPAGDVVLFDDLRHYVERNVLAETGRQIGASGAHFGDFPLAGRVAAARPLRQTVAGAATTKGTSAILNPVAWPGPAAPDAAAAAIDAWAAMQRKLPNPLVQRIVRSSASHTMLLIFQAVTEKRQEREVELSTRREAAENVYLGSIKHYRFDFNDESDWTPVGAPVVVDGRKLTPLRGFRGYRRGREVLRDCPACDRGRTACSRCAGEGVITVTVNRAEAGTAKTTPDPTTPTVLKRCPDCKAGMTKCTRCEGVGILTVRVEGEIKRWRAMTRILVPNATRGPVNAEEYSAVGLLDDLDLGALPVAVSEAVAKRAAAETERLLRRGAVRARTECAVRLCTVVTFHDGHNSYQVDLVGPEHRVVAPLGLAEAIRADYRIRKRRQAVKDARERLRRFGRRQQGG